MLHKWRRLKMSLLNPCCDLMALTILYFFKRMSYCRMLISHPFEPSEWVLVRLKFLQAFQAKSEALSLFERETFQPASLE